MKYIFKINIQTDGDFGFQFVPIGMTQESYGWFSFERTYTDRVKAIEDVEEVCRFLRENIHTSRDSMVERWHTCIDNFLDSLRNSEASIEEYVEENIYGNYDGTEFIFRAAPNVVNFKFDVTDEEYARILDHRINVKQEKVKAAILALYDDSKRECMDITKIWIFEILDGIGGGFIIAETEEEARTKLSLQRGVEMSEDITAIYPLTALDLNKDVHDLW